MTPCIYIYVCVCDVCVCVCVCMTCVCVCVCVSHWHPTHRWREAISRYQTKYGFLPFDGDDTVLAALEEVGDTQKHTHAGPWYL